MGQARKASARFETEGCSLIVVGDFVPNAFAGHSSRSIGGSGPTTPSGERQTQRASSLSPQKYESCHEAESAATGMENAPSPNHAARFGRGGIRGRIHQTPVGRRDHDRLQLRRWSSWRAANCGVLIGYYISRRAVAMLSHPRMKV